MTIPSAPATPKQVPDTKKEPAAPTKKNDDIDRRKKIVANARHYALQEVAIAFMLNAVETMGTEAAKALLGDMISEKAMKGLGVGIDALFDALEKPLLPEKEGAGCC